MSSARPGERSSEFLRIRGLSKQYGKYFAVRSLDLEIGKGEFLSLLGPSGCGKSTTLGMLAGFVEPSGGSIMLEGRDITRLPMRERGLGVVFQNYALFPHMTAAQNISFGLEMRKVATKERSARISEVLELVGLEAVQDRFPTEMSGGQQQRVALARALVIRPAILLLDEPLSNLDAKRREEMQLELRRIQQTLGTTTIMVTHDQSEALAMSDRVAVMHEGRVEQLGQPQEVYAHPKNAFVADFLGKATILPASELVPGLDHAGVLRPENIQLVAPGQGRLNGTVKTAVFQGSRWMFEIHTERGIVTAEQPNSGESIPLQGSTVGVAWRDENVHRLGDPA